MLDAGSAGPATVESVVEANAARSFSGQSIIASALHAGEHEVCDLPGPDVALLPHQDPTRFSSAKLEVRQAPKSEGDPVDYAPLAEVSLQDGIDRRMVTVAMVMIQLTPLAAVNH